MQFIALLFSGDIWTMIGGCIVLIGGGIVFWLKGKDSINQGEVGFVQRNGAVRRDKNGEPRERGPGLILLVPWIDKLWRTSAQRRTRNLDDQQRVEIRNGKKVGYQDVRSAVFYRVTKPILVLNETEDLDDQVVKICNKHLLEQIQKGRSNKKIHSIFGNLVKDELAQIGVTYIDLMFQFSGDTMATQFNRTAAVNMPPTTVPFVPVMTHSAGNGSSNGNGHKPAEEIEAS